ncbi:shikimate kinase domain-containing protein [Cordyceps javanica]|uniref:Shikimate kinase domain-containing protein n=1 Tax=Cordyceps javanica TaxID=43265 RepID=A0A545UKU3_9HYPO|nr:shikimate kinase domain-containing protein [Cordyceps javanica]TQW01575.1 shikimate kinase domain-containing protein [Cordyceps javanica]
METRTVILIGPEGAGKSTIGKLLAKALSKELFSLDRHRNELYAPYNYNQAEAEQIYKEQGEWAFYLHWTAFEFKAVSHILQNALNAHDTFYGKILDFGAGHSVYEKPEQLAAIEEYLRPYPDVFLILPCKDTEEAIRVREARRGHKLGLNKHFLEHESNRRLAKHIIYTKNKTPTESLEELLQVLLTKSTSG